MHLNPLKQRFRFDLKVINPIFYQGAKVERGCSFGPLIYLFIQISFYMGKGVNFFLDFGDDVFLALNLQGRIYQSLL
jgi:hypothetical protein